MLEIAGGILLAYFVIKVGLPLLRLALILLALASVIGAIVGR